jgi:hypothetical protein
VYYINKVGEFFNGGTEKHKNIEKSKRNMTNTSSIKNVEDINSLANFILYKGSFLSKDKVLYF